MKNDPCESFWGALNDYQDGRLNGRRRRALEAAAGGDEVVRAEASSDEAVERAAALARQIGKTPVVVADRPCFVVNRVLIPMINEAARALESGVADAESIDKAMTLGAGFRMGPLHLADLIGLDVVVAELRELARSLGPAYAPSAELVRRAERGELGRKTGAGFFAYRR